MIGHRYGWHVQSKPEPGPVGPPPPGPGAVSQPDWARAGLTKDQYDYIVARYGCVAYAPRHANADLITEALAWADQLDRSIHVSHSGAALVRRLVDALVAK